MLTFQVKIVSRALSIPIISTSQLDRLTLIKKLHSDGLSDTAIADFLNSKGLKTPKGKKYYQELIWVTRNKFNKRNLREQEFNYQIENMKFSPK